LLLLLLQEHAANPAEGWRAKDCAVYLVMAVTVKGRTGEKGATTTRQLVDVGEFFASQVCVCCLAPFQKVQANPHTSCVWVDGRGL
jgi:hypothetical protein